MAANLGLLGVPFAAKLVPKLGPVFPLAPRADPNHGPFIDKTQFSLLVTVVVLSAMAVGMIAEIGGAYLVWQGRRRDHVRAMTPKELVERLVEIVNDGDLDAITDVATGQIARDAARWIGPFRESFPDFRMEVMDVIAEGDKVVGYFKCSGTHQGEWQGRAPTGRRFQDVDEIYIFKVEGGKLASTVVAVGDHLTRLRQLGVQ